MPVQVEWADPSRRAICQIYSGDVVLDNYYDATDQVAALARTVPYTVHSIMDRSAVTSSVNSALPALLYANRNLPENLGLRIIINPSVYTRMIIHIGTKIAPRVINNVRFANDLQEAQEIVGERAAELENF